MILFYILAVYCIVRCILTSRSNLKAAHAVINHFDVVDESPSKIFIESILAAVIDSILIFIVGSIVIYALICVAEGFHIGGLL